MDIINNIMDENVCTTLTICGSYRFRNLKEKYQAYYTIKNNVVFAPINYMLIKGDVETTQDISEHNANIMRNIHNKKIDLSDAIIVVTGLGYDYYIGEDTTKEIIYAYQNKKPILFTSIPKDIDKEDVYFNNNLNYPLYMPIIVSINEEE